MQYKEETKLAVLLSFLPTAPFHSTSFASSQSVLTAHHSFLFTHSYILIVSFFFTIVVLFFACNQMRKDGGASVPAGSDPCECLK